MKETYKLPQVAEQVINEYLNLPIGGKYVKCPYHINIQKERVGLRVLVGKGDPGEIVKEVKVWAKLKDLDLYKANEEQIRKFMIDRSIGIDCSGFVVHVLGYWLKIQNGKRLWREVTYPKNDLMSKLRRLLRPIENLSANTLTSLENCESINDLNEIRPGDLLRSKGRVKNSHHISLISKVTLIDGKMQEIEYVHSQRYYDDDNGVRYGTIRIKNLKLPLEKQEWLEVKNGRNWTLEGYLKELDDNGIRRLKKIKLHFEKV
jgi:hypothetical protein